MCVNSVGILLGRTHSRGRLHHITKHIHTPSKNDPITAGMGVPTPLRRGRAAGRAGCRTSGTGIRTIVHRVEERLQIEERFWFAGAQRDRCGTRP